MSRFVLNPPAPSMVSANEVVAVGHFAAIHAGNREIRNGVCRIVGDVTRRIARRDADRELDDVDQHENGLFDSERNGPGSLR